MAGFVHVYTGILSFSNVMTVYNCNCLHVSIIRVIGITLLSFIFLHLPVSEIAECVLPEAVYYCFTTTTLQCLLLLLWYVH